MSCAQLFVPEKVPKDMVGRKDQVLGYQARDKQLEPLAAQMQETKLMAQQLALSCEVLPILRPLHAVLLRPIRNRIANSESHAQQENKELKVSSC